MTLGTILGICMGVVSGSTPGPPLASPRGSHSSGKSPVTRLRAIDWVFTKRRLPVGPHRDEYTYIYIYSVYTDMNMSI